MIFNAKNGMNPYWFIGEVVDKDDPANAGRVRVRAFGLHPIEPFVADNKEEKDAPGIEDQDLPWAFCIQGAYGSINALPDEGEWVLGFMADGREAQHPFVLGTIPGSNLDDLGVPGGIGATAGGARGDGLRGSSGSGERYLTNARVDEILNGPEVGQARANAEEFLGRPISDRDWDQLMAATVAESAPNSPEEQAYVMAVILNRVRMDGYPNTIDGVLTAPFQFQAVTGTSADGNRPSNNFLNPARSQLASTVDGVNRYLSGAPRNWENFTSNNPAAYGPGTNIGFLRTMRSRPGNRVVGGTIFGND